MPNLDPITGFPIPQDYGNTGLDKFTAGMALANPISGWSDRRFAPNYKADLPEENKSSYDPWADPRIEKYDPMHFVDSRSKEETTNMIGDIERNIALQKRATGIPSVAGTVTGVFSNPLIMLPALATSGSSIPAMMAAETGGEILSELMLHSQQPLRTKTESALNIGFATMAAGLGGVVQKKLGRSATREVADTAHGGDGMYAHPIPEEARTGVDAASRKSSEDMAMHTVEEPEYVQSLKGMDDPTEIYEELTKIASENLDESWVKNLPKVGFRNQDEASGFVEDIATGRTPIEPPEGEIFIYHGRSSALTSESRNIEGTGIHFSKNWGTSVDNYTSYEGGVLHRTSIKPNELLELPEWIDELTELDELPWTPNSIAVKMKSEGIIKNIDEIQSADDIWKVLESKGYKGIKYVSDETGESYILKELPDNIEMSGKITPETRISRIDDLFEPDIAVLEKAAIKTESILKKATARVTAARKALKDAGCN